MTDHYSQCEAAAIAKLRTLSIFQDKALVSDNIDDLNRGLRYFGYIFPSTFSSVRVDGHDKAVTWIIGLELYVRYKTKKESVPLFKAARAAIFELYNSDPMLNKTPNVFNVLINATSEVLQDIPGDNPNFIIQTFGLAVSQRVRFAF